MVKFTIDIAKEIYENEYLILLGELEWRIKRRSISIPHMRKIKSLTWVIFAKESIDSFYGINLCNYRLKCKAIVTISEIGRV